MALFKLTPPYLSINHHVNGHMVQVLLAMIPATIALTWFFGPGISINISLACLVALLTEAAMLRLRHRPLKPFLTDGSAIVTAMLLAVAIPPLAPWWLTTVGIIFAIVFAKHLYGGLGFNPFNPAMAAYVLLLISFPVEMTQWLPNIETSVVDINLISAFQLIFTEQLPTQITLDAISGATPLDIMKTQIGLQQTPETIQQNSQFGWLSGQGWQWVNIWFAVGGLALLYRKVISWHIPTAMLLALTAISLITWLIAPETTASPLFHLFSGGTMIGAFFIATDPVSASTTLKGKLIYGAGIGLLIYIIRVWGGYPDGVAFAVLLMNMLVPLIDDYTQPRVYGAKH